MSIWKNGKLVAGGRQTTPLLSFMWSDHILNDVQWLRADTFSWQDGGVYEAAYNHLADDIDGKSLSSEIISGITIQFYLADDGHKICPASEESNVVAIYNATGVAWYYILDTVNQKFKLPRSKHEHYGDRPVVGNGYGLGLKDSSSTKFLMQGMGGSASNNTYALSESSTNGTVGTAGSRSSLANDKIIGVSTDPDKSGVISTPVEDTDQYKYLYFYVGNFTQTALENTAGITAETLNDKVDKGHEVIEFQAPTSQNNYTWYRKYADGWVEQGGTLTYTARQSAYSTISLPIQMANNHYTLVSEPGYTARSDTATGQHVASRNGLKTTTTIFIAAYGNGADDLTDYIDWQVSGMAA